jgi:hypothetical protein
MFGSVFLTRLILTMIALLLLCACAPLAPRPAATVPEQWDAFVAGYIEDHFAAVPTFAVRAGRHEFDGKLPDWSEAGLQRESARLQAAHARAQAFAAAALTESQRFERDYLLAIIDKNLFWLTTAGWPSKNPLYYGRDLDPEVYVTREYAPLAVRMQAYIAYARAIPEAVAQIRTNLRPPLPRTYIENGRLIFGGLAAFYAREVPAVFAAVPDEQLQEELRLANSAALRAVQEMDAWLEAQQARATEDFALGAELFGEMLRRTEQIDLPLERLETLGRQDLERNLAALREACALFVPDAPLAACVDKMKKNKPAGGAVAGARRQLDELKKFVIARQVVTIPGSEEARVAESPPYMRWNLAYIAIPGPYEQGLPATYYVAPPDPTWSAAERQAYLPEEAKLLFVSVHEVWPGHFLQHLHAHRAVSKIGKLFTSYAFSEGWAHYSEEMMWEAGLGAGDPETHIGQILEALLRNVRFLSAIALHTGGMTVAESEELFREAAYLDPGNARQQAARGTFDPAYLNYTLGKLMIRKLRDDWSATRGGRQAWPAFHDAFLSRGAPPIPLVRAALLGPEGGLPL